MTAGRQGVCRPAWVVWISLSIIMWHCHGCAAISGVQNCRCCLRTVHTLHCPGGAGLPGLYAAVRLPDGATGASHTDRCALLVVGLQVQVQAHTRHETHLQGP